MNKNEKFVITINRELGSGGRTIGRKLAEKLGVQFFDKALLMALEEKYGVSLDNYFFTVSSLLPHKNIDTLLDVMKKIQNQLKTALNIFLE